jgi:RNA polymerase sigma-70 factor (ECF subfamily)
MVGAMAKIVEPTETDDLVLRARADAEALGRLYDLHYDRIFRFCVCRVFCRETAEDITSRTFLTVARRISTFKGRTSSDFGNWLYAIAANHASSYIRKASRRKELFSEAVAARSQDQTDSTDEQARLDWPMLYAGIFKLKPKQQTVVILRFFESMEFEQIAKVVGNRPTAVRVTLHRALKQLRNHLQDFADGGA